LGLAANFPKLDRPAPSPNVMQYFIPMRQLFKILVFIIVISSSSCGLIPSLDCNINMTKNYIKSSCGLINGVVFRELTVYEFDSTNLPSHYKVVFSTNCYNPGTNPVQKFWPDKIYFNKPNGHYLWRIDSIVNGTYKRTGPYTNRTDGSDIPIIDTAGPEWSQAFIDSIIKAPGTPDPNSKSICPTKFKPATWYFVGFSDQRYEAFLYVDKKMNYNLHKISLPTNF
jgi:hypothetical protein